MGKTDEIANQAAKEIEGIPWKTRFSIVVALLIITLFLSFLFGHQVSEKFKKITSPKTEFLEKTNLEDCLKENSRTAECTRLINQIKNIGECENYKDSRNICISRVAENNLDLSICNQITEETIKEKCQNKLNEITATENE